MFLKMRKSDKNKSIQSSDVPETEQTNEKVDHEEDKLVNQITDLEESANKGTRELVDANQLNELPEIENSTEEDGDEVRAKGVPAQILELDTEPEVEPEEEAPGEEKNVDILLEPAGPVNVEPEPEGEVDMLSDIFSEADEEVNPLMGLIMSLPYVNAEEILDDLQAIKRMMHEKR